MLEKIKNEDTMKKIVIGVVVFDIIIVVLAAFLHNVFANAGNTESENVVQEKETEQTTEIEEVMETAEHDMNEIYESLLIGDYFTDNGLEFNFQQNHMYSGFFSSEKVNVTGYQYEIISDENGSYVNIYDTNKTEKVSYILTIDAAGKMILTFPNNGDSITLG